MKRSKFSAIVPLWILVACSLPACSDSGSNNSAQADGGAGGEGGSDTEVTTSTGGAGGSSGVSCTKYGPITKDTTWKATAECPDGFEVPEYVTVSGAGTVLTIDPGVTLTFSSGSGIEVQASASLVAVGTAAKPITFTGWQKEPGAWGGLTFRSSAVANEVAYAIVEYGGEPDGASAAIVLSHDEQYARLKLSNTEIRKNAQFGLTVYERTTLPVFDDNTISENASGAIRVEAPSVHQLNGTGNSLVDNGDGNIVRLEASSLMTIEDEDVSWPNLSPAVYRVTGTGGDEGGQIFIKRHVTIEQGAVFEFVGGSGIDVKDGTAGLSAIGTAAKPIIFKGVDGSGWAGIGFCETSWSGNALEYVTIENAAGPPYSSWGCAGATAAGVIVGHMLSPNKSALRIKNVTFLGENAGPYDFALHSPSTLTQQGNNVGTGTAGALVIRTL